MDNEKKIILVIDDNTAQFNFVAGELNSNSSNRYLAIPSADISNGVPSVYSVFIDKLQDIFPNSKSSKSSTEIESAQTNQEAEILKILSGEDAINHILSHYNIYGFVIDYILDIHNKKCNGIEFYEKFIVNNQQCAKYKQSPVLWVTKEQAGNLTTLDDYINKLKNQGIKTERASITTKIDQMYREKNRSDFNTKVKNVFGNELKNTQQGNGLSVDADISK